MLGFWNLEKLGIALSPILSQEEVKEELAKYWDQYEKFYMEHMRAKLGLLTQGSTYITPN
jgi:uncharacterized protein YdiU (UPF0061 family)